MNNTEAYLLDLYTSESMLRDPSHIHVFNSDYGVIKVGNQIVMKCQCGAKKVF